MTGEMTANYCSRHRKSMLDIELGGDSKIIPEENIRAGAPELASPSSKSTEFSTGQGKGDLLRGLPFLEKFAAYYLVVEGCVVVERGRAAGVGADGAGAATPEEAL